MNDRAGAVGPTKTTRREDEPGRFWQMTGMWVSALVVAIVVTVAGYEGAAHVASVFAGCLVICACSVLGALLDVDRWAKRRRERRRVVS